MPMICVRDVEASSRWYQAVLGCTSGHGGPEYEQIVHDGRIALQLHRWDTDEHPHMGRPDAGPAGNGAILWFETGAFAAAVERVRASGCVVLEEPHVNPLANHREVWVRDPDGYVVVVASAYGDV
jgi:catechol 2,3-dioxygenase-like lactoylglutathione lyase family enzyme